MEYKEYTGKTVEDAITEALIALEITSDSLDYEVVEEGSSGFLGIGSKNAVIRAKVKEPEKVPVEAFLKDVLDKMGIEASVSVETDETENCMNINIDGEDTGEVIGKRGQTLDALQYLASIIVNKDGEEYCRVKLDTKNYRERRQKTLENLAKNVASKVKKTRHKIILEPMNPYERRIIHSYLQNDKFIETKSKGEEPNRRIVVYYKR